MTKRELIDEITELNPTAMPAFLARFEDSQLAEYLDHLKWLGPPEPFKRRAGHKASARPRPREERRLAVG